MIIGHFIFRRKWLHNDYYAKVEYRGISYKSVTHAFYAIKSRPTFHDYVAAGNGTEEVRRRAQHVQARYWTEGKLRRLMLKLLQSKFSISPKLRTKLLATFPHELMYGNLEGDTYWGVDRKTGKGDNWLGILLTNLRGMIRDGTDHKVPLMKAAKIRRNLAYFQRIRDKIADANLGTVVYPLPKITGATRAAYHPSDYKRKHETKRSRVTTQIR